MDYVKGHLVIWSTEGPNELLQERTIVRELKKKRAEKEGRTS